MVICQDSLHFLLIAKCDYLASFRRRSRLLIRHYKIEADGLPRIEAIFIVKDYDERIIDRVSVRFDPIDTNETAFQRVSLRSNTINWMKSISVELYQNYDDFMDSVTEVESTTVNC